MKFVVEDIHLWIAPEQQLDTPFEYANKSLDVSWVPAMQRRRLSPYMKMVLHCINKVGAGQQQIPINFSSRHGDLHKTATLLNDITLQSPLSPTAFGLSVHNASVGLFSILTNNKAPMNAIAAGKHSLINTIIDAYARLHTSDVKSIIICHSDRVLPNEYLAFADELQIEHCIAFRIRLPNPSEPYYKLENTQPSYNSAKEGLLPISLQLADFLLNRQKTTTLLSSDRKSWSLDFYDA